MAESLSQVFENGIPGTLWQCAFEVSVMRFARNGGISRILQLRGSSQRLYCVDFAVLWQCPLPQVFERTKSPVMWQESLPQDRESAVPVVLWKSRGAQQRGIGSSCESWQKHHGIDQTDT